MSNYGDTLRKERRLELAMRALPPEMFNEYGEVTFATKTEAGKSFPASDYAYVPDPDKPSTWKLRLTSTPGGDPDPQIVGAAVAALGKGFRGNKVQIPAEDLPKVKAKVKAAWLKANPDKDSSDLPAILASAVIDEVSLEAGDVEEFNLKNLSKALNNINDTIDALEADPPKVASALSNARDTKKNIQSAIDAYGNSPVVRRRIYVSPPPPAPAPTPTP